jgi:transcriptional regulator with XRE-family HTH domain
MMLGMAPEPITTNGRAIRRYRKLAGLSNRTLAAQAGISSSHLAHVEAQRRGVSPEVLALIAKALGRPTADLVNDSMAVA